MSTNAVRRSGSSLATRSSSPTRSVGRRRLVGRRHRLELGTRRGSGAAAAPPPHRVGAGPPGDREQPGPGRGVAPEAGKGGDGPEEDLLGEVVGGGAIDEVGAQPPHVGLGAPDEPDQGGVVAVTGRARQPGQFVHRRKAWRVGNQEGQCGDHYRMRCEDCREAISAQFDDEVAPEGATDDLVQSHLTTCAACRRFARGATLVHREVRVRPAEPVPDLTAAILGALPPDAHPRPVREWARYALLAVALTQLVLALPALLFGEDPGASVHVARDLGSFDVALAIGLLWAAWQPHRASGLLPMALALGFAIALTAGIDLVQGDAGAGAEAHHVLDLAGIVLLYLLARPADERAPSLRRRDPDPRLTLRRLLRILVGAALAAIALAAAASPAAAHAVLESSDPADGARLDRRPRRR